MAQNFTSFTPVEEAEPQTPTKFSTFTPIEESGAKPPAKFTTFTPIESVATTPAAPVVKPTPAPVKTAAVADTDYDTGNAAGDDLGSAIMNAPQSYQSIMIGQKPPVLPTEDQAVVNPKFVDAVQAQLNAMPANQRQAALNKMTQRDDVYGRAARAIAGRYAAADQNQTPTARNFDRRREAQAERLVSQKQGLTPELANQYAEQSAQTGQLMPDLDQLKEAPEEYISKQQGAKPATYGETIGANFAGGFADTLVSAAAALTDYTGASDTAAKLDATRKSIREFQAQYGGDTRLGRVSSMTGALTPALVEVLAAPFTGGSSLIPLMTTGVLFALPGFRDTYKQQLKSGAPQSVAIEQGLASAGMMMIGGRLIATGGRALPKALQASDRLLPQLTSAAAEGTIFNAADSATHKVIDKLNGRDTDAPWFDPESALENALAFSAMRGIHKGIEHVQGKKAADEHMPYALEDNYDKLVDLAKSKGFLTPEERQQRQEQKAPAAPAVEEPPLPPDLLGDVRPSDDLKEEISPAPREERVTQLAEEIQKRTNIPIENATRIAESRIAEEEKANAPAETKAEGAENVGQAITEPSGERPDLAEQPDTNVPTTGARVAEPDRVVPARQNVARTVEPKGAKSTTVTKFLNLPEAKEGEPAMKVQDGARQPVPMSALTTPEAIERAEKVLGGNTPEEVVHNLNLANQRGGLATWEVETILGLRDQNQKTKPAPVKPTLGERIGLPEGPAKENAVNEKIPIDDKILLKRMVVKTVEDGLTAGRTREQIIQQLEALTKGGIKNTDMQRIHDYLTEKGVKETPTTVKPPEGKTLIEEIQELHAQGKATDEDLAKVTSWVNANDEPRVFGKKLFELINEIERRPSEEQKAAEIKPTEEVHAPVEEAKVEETTPAEQPATLEENTPEQVAQKLNADHEALIAARESIGKKRGRPSLERTEEQENKLVLSRKEQKKLTDNADYQLKKLKGMLDEALKPLDEELEADKVDEAETDKEKAKKYVTTQLLELNLNPNLRGTAVGNRVKALLNDRSKISQADIDAAKRGMEIRAKTDLRGEIGESFQGRSSLASRVMSKGKPNTAFNKATNAAQAISIIAKTGNAFQKFLANRLRSFTHGVSFVVIEKDDVLPTAMRDYMRTANALYSRGTKTIYVKGESWGDGHSLSNIPVLHELLHAATDRRIELGKSGKLGAFVKELTELSDRVKAQYERMDSMGLVPDDLRQRVEATIVTDADGTAHYDIFRTPQEFLAYGMSDEVFQEFLGRVKGTQNENGFSSFVRTMFDAWAKHFGMGKNDFSAMSDLINITDKVLSEKAPAGRELPARTFANERPGEEGALERTEAQQKEAVAKALNAVALSRAGNELGKAVSVAAALRDPRLVWREMKLAWGSMSDATRSFVSHFYDLEAIAKGPGAHIKSLQDLYEAVQKKNGMTEIILRGAADQSESLVRFFNAHPKFKTIFEDLVNASTHSAYDPSKPNKHRDIALDLMYNALPERGKEAYKNLRDYYKDMDDFQKQIIADQIDKLDLPAGERDKIMAGIREIYEGEKSVEPYFPLMRYGDYILEIGKGTNRTSIRYETKMERDRAALEYAKKRNANLQDLRTSKEVKISDDIGSSKMRATIEGTSELLKAAYKAVDAAKLTEPGAKESIKDNLYQAYLTSMPEASVRKMFMHRKGTPGFSSDVLKNVNSMGIKMSRQFAKLRYAPDMRNALSAANKVIAEDPTYKAFVARANELAAESLQPPERTSLAKFMDTASGIVVKVSYLRYMTSWSSAIMQPLDIFLKGIPTLLGNHGPKGPAELTKMLKIWNQFGITEYQSDGTTRWRMPSIEHATGLTPMERRAVREMVAWGVHKNTLASTVFNQAKKPTTNKIWQTTKDVMGNLILGNLMHHGERLSREVVYLTSFRLNFDKSKNFDDAVKKAVAETNEVYGDYSPDNRPLAMRGATGKLVTMYKFFPLVTYKNLIGNFFKVLSTTNSPKEKVQAATKFFGVMGTHLLLGGLEALPMFSVVMSILGAAWNQWGRDPDAPDEMKNISYETWWKTKFMPEKFGDWSELLKKGAANHLTGWDISSRISLNDMWFRAPTMPAASNKEIMGNWALALAGPVPSLVLSATQGLQEIANGQYERGLEKILPGSISNLMIAHRYATEGFQTPQGAQLAKPGTMDKSEIAGQSIGYRPAAIAAAQEIAFKAKVVEKVVLAEKNQLTNQYKDNFIKSTDPTMPVDFQQRFNQKWGDTLDKVIDFNIRHPKTQINIEELNKSLSERINNIIETEIGGGVRITPENLDLLGDAANEAEKALSKYNKKKE
jgi:hypothetical protein